MKYDIITIGSATRDVFLQVKALHTHPAKDTLTHIEAALPFGSKINVEQIHFDTGGGATNSAATFARLGKFHVAALTRVGPDNAGRDILAALKHDHVDTSFIQRDTKESTGFSAILFHSETASERTILVHRGASQKFDTKIPWNKLQAKWFYITSLGGDIALLKKILNHAKKIGAKVMWNPGKTEIEKAAGKSLALSGKKLSFEEPLIFLLVNREEAAQLTGVPFENTKKLLRGLAGFAPIAIMTDGSKGAYATLGNTECFHAQHSVLGTSENTKCPAGHLVLDACAYHIASGGSKPKNLTGAGDAFGSGFLTGWTKSKGDIKEALRVGTLNADSVVRKIGAKNGILKKCPNRKLHIKEIRL